MVGLATQLVRVMRGTNVQRCVRIRLGQGDGWQRDVTIRPTLGKEHAEVCSDVRLQDEDDT